MVAAHLVHVLRQIAFLNINWVVFVVVVDTVLVQSDRGVRDRMQVLHLIAVDMIVVSVLAVQEKAGNRHDPKFRERREVSVFAAEILLVER